MTRAKRESAIMEAAAMSSCPWWSVLCARAYATLSSTSLPMRPYLRGNAVAHQGCLCGTQLCALGG